MNAATSKQKLFLSYNSGDKQFVATLASTLALVGAEVWFDAWKIRPGDSIPAEISNGLTEHDMFVLVWSRHAAQSTWVANELNAAVALMIADPARRFIPLVLDPTPLPALVAARRYVDAMAERTPIDIAKEILGIKSDKAMLMAVQAVIDDAGLTVKEFWGAGVFVCCPKCGASVDKLQGFQTSADDHDRSYAGAECGICGWQECSEM